MAVVKKEDVKPPVLPKETVSVEGIGDVVVQGLLLSDRLEIFGAGRSVKVSHLLEKSVIDASGEPLWTAHEWEVFGAPKQGFIETMKLYKVARRLSGLDSEVAEKN